MRLHLTALLLLAACKGGSEGAREWRGADFVPAEGLGLEYRALAAVDTDSGLEADTGLMLRADGGWAVRSGASWTEGVEVGVFTVSLDDGLTVDGAQMLPDQITDGASGDGWSIVAMGEASTYYGTFPDAVTVEIAEGRWAGTQVLAPGLGPVAPTIDGATWDLVYYE